MVTAEMSPATGSQPSRSRAPLRGADEYPVVERCTYLSVCDSTVLGVSARKAVDEFLDHITHWRESRDVREVRVEGARAKFARLIGAQAADVAIVKNVSEGINAIATAIPWQAGDNVVFCAGLEHPNNVLPWMHLRRLGVEARVVDAVDGAIDAAAMVAAIDARTRVVTASSVSFAPGLRTDLAAIGRACRARGVLFLVDAVQSAGILSLDAERDHFDALVASTAKGLLGMYGCGFLYVRREWAERLTPAYLSRPAVDLPPERYSEMAGLEAQMRPNAVRFEVGAVDYASCYAVDASLDVLWAAGPAAIEAHVLALTARLRSGMAALGLEIPRRAGGAEASHIVTIGRLGNGGHGVANDPLLAVISMRLAQQDVIHTIRRGMLRFGFHLYNSDKDVDRVLAISEEAVRNTRA